MPLSLDRLDLFGRGDEIEFAACKYNAGRIAQRFAVQRRTEMKMPRNEIRLDLCPAQFPADEIRGRALPDRMLKVDDRRHQRDKTEIAFDRGEQRADPCAVTGGQHAELATT